MAKISTFSVDGIFSEKISFREKDSFPKKNSYPHIFPIFNKFHSRKKIIESNSFKIKLSFQDFLIT